MNEQAKKGLFIGYGNPGRQDDGLGPALAEKVEESTPSDWVVEIDYQLVVEHAFDIAGYETVIFADASVNGETPFFYREVLPEPPEDLTSHGLSPEAVMYLAKTLFQCNAQGFVLGIRGYDFDKFEERLSNAAQNNLEAAHRFVLAKFQLIMSFFAFSLLLKY